MQKISILLEHWWVGGRRNLWMLLFCHKMSQACAYLVLTHLCGILGSETLLWLENTWICIFCWNKKTRPDFGRPSQTVRKNSGKQKHYSGKEKAAFRQKNDTCEFVFAKLFQSKGQVGQTMDTCWRIHVRLNQLMAKSFLLVTAMMKPHVCAMPMSA